MEYNNHCPFPIILFSGILYHLKEEEEEKEKEEEELWWSPIEADCGGTHLESQYSDRLSQSIPPSRVLYVS